MLERFTPTIRKRIRQTTVALTATAVVAGAAVSAEAAGYDVGGALSSATSTAKGFYDYLAEKGERQAAEDIQMVRRIFLLNPLPEKEAEVSLPTFSRETLLCDLTSSGERQIFTCPGRTEDPADDIRVWINHSEESQVKAGILLPGQDIPSSTIPVTQSRSREFNLGDISVFVQNNNYRTHVKQVR